jgi:hypothetical protein
MSSIIEAVSALTVGTVEFVAPDEIKILLELDAPQATALNTGVPSRFPRINGFVLIPNEAGALVGLVTWLGVERAAYPKRTGLRDFGLIDLPFPLRKMSLNPVGTLRVRSDESGTTTFELERGVVVFPSVGDPVALPTREQLRAIVESQGANARVVVGTSPLAADASVAVDPDKLFGRHLAVLGNTGSGKSCSVAGLVRWSLEAAREERSRTGKTGDVNARFIILDPNGEYTKTFGDLPSSVRIFRAPLFGNVEAEEGVNTLPLTVPAWMWNSHEWAALTKAAPGYQRPLLLQGLRGIRAGTELTDDPATTLAENLRGYRTWLDQLLILGPAKFGGDTGTKMQCGRYLVTLRDEMQHKADRGQEDEVRAILDEVTRLELAKQSPGAQGTIWYDPFTEAELRTVADLIDEAVAALPLVERNYGVSEDAPLKFDVSNLTNFLDVLSKTEDFAQGAQYLPTLLMRIKTILADPQLAPIINPEGDSSLATWLETLVGEDAAASGQIAIIDLSLVPSDVLHVTIAVIARLIFESAQRYRKLTGKELPTTIVLEEAHTFVRRPNSEDTADGAAAALCRETFERIAREGRKFGVGLVLSSQRPSELSPTALAQCNTFLLHRIVNDQDQRLVAGLVPDNLRGLLRELPSLPSRQAILLGWAAPIPILVEINELPEEHRPRSEDPRFWSVWTGEESRSIDWQAIEDDWLGTREVE